MSDPSGAVGGASSLATAEIHSPLGPLRIAATAAGLARIAFASGARSDFQGWLERHVPSADVVTNLPALDTACKELRAYFDGGLTKFTVPLDLRGTSFQLAVWQKLREIPFGETWTYGQMAERLGKPGAQRAVGLANGSNPVAIVVPCHRVTAARGRLGGFGGGLQAKRWLLAFEGRGLPLLRRSR